MLRVAWRVIQQQFQDESMKRNLIVILSLKLKLPQQERGWMPLTKYVRSEKNKMSFY